MKFSTIALTTVVAAAFSLLGCASQSQWQNMNPDQFSQVIAGDNIQIVDVRTAAEYSEGHIENAVNIDVTADTFTSIAEHQLDREQPVAVYCRSGNRSKRAIQILSSKGFKTIYHLEGGMKSWTGAGLSTTKSNPEK